MGFTTAHGPVVIPMGYAAAPGYDPAPWLGEEPPFLNDLAKGTGRLYHGHLARRPSCSRASTFHHSMNYRSVVVFGRSSVIEDEQTDVWLDVERLKLGDRWMEEFERTLAESHSPAREATRQRGEKTARSHKRINTVLPLHETYEAWENSEPAFGVGQRGAGVFPSVG